MRILVNTNGKKYSEQAMHFAGRLFRSLKPIFTILYVLEPSSSISEELAKKYLERGQEILSKYKLKAKTKLTNGQKAEQVVKVAKTGSYDLVVLGARGTALALRSLSEYNIGKVSDRVIQVIANSFLLVKNPPMQIKKVLLCIDGSADSLAAINFWGKLNQKQKVQDVQVNILNVIPEFYTHFKDILGPVAKEQLKSLETLPETRTRYLFDVKRILTKYGIKSQIRLREGQAAEEILKESERNYDLIVVGLRGRKAQRKSTIGRQALKIARYAKVSVLVVTKS